MVFANMAVADVLQLVWDFLAFEDGARLDAVCVAWRRAVIGHRVVYRTLSSACDHLTSHVLEFGPTAAHLSVTLDGTDTNAAMRSLDVLLRAELMATRTLRLAVGPHWPLREDSKAMDFLIMVLRRTTGGQLRQLTLQHMSLLESTLQWQHLNDVLADHWGRLDRFALDVYQRTDYSRAVGRMCETIARALCRVRDVFIRITHVAIQTHNNDLMVVVLALRRAMRAAGMDTSVCERLQFKATNFVESQMIECLVDVLLSLPRLTELDMCLVSNTIGDAQGIASCGGLRLLRRLRLDVRHTELTTVGFWHLWTGAMMLPLLLDLHLDASHNDDIDVASEDALPSSPVLQRLHIDLRRSVRCTAPLLAAAWTLRLRRDCPALRTVDILA